MAFEYKDIIPSDIKLLHIDDEEESLKFLKMFLPKINPLIVIESVSSPLHALTILESKSFDVIVSDYQMPEIDGLELLQRIRNKNINTPFIILTGKSKEEIAIKALNLGVDFYLQKILNTTILYTELNHLILQAVEKRHHIEALVKAEERYHALTENSDVGFYQVALNGDIIYLNKTMMKILEIHDLKIIKEQKNLFFIAPESIPIVKKQRENRLKNETTSYQASIITLNGKKKFGIISGAAIKNKNGQIESFIGSFTDITENISISKSLKEKENLIEALTEILPIGVTVSRWEDEKILYINEYAANCIGLSKEVILGEKISRYYSDIRNYTEIILSLQKGNTVYAEEIKRKKNTGSEYWVELSAKEISYQGEMALLEITQNITQRKQKEIQESVSKEIEEEKLKKQKSELSTFAHIMAHDLRNLLFAIEGYATLLKGKKLDETYSDSIQSLAQRSLRFLKRSLDLAEAGQIIEKIDKVDLNQTIKVSAEVSIPKSINFFSENLPTVIADQDKVFQIFKNLFENAVVHGHPKNIIITCCTQTDNVIISVKNNGSPIPMELKDDIENGRTKGLGYKIINKLVKAHGWNIRLVNIDEPTFELSIPINQVIKDF